LILPIIFFDQNKKLFAMATLYTKTALKKIGKDELIQMYLDLQAKVIDDNMDDEIEKLKGENEKLKKQLNQKLQKLQREVKMWENAVDM